MALTLNNFIGFETGGNEEAKATSGTPLYNTVDEKTGTYCLELTAGTADYYDIEPFEGGTSDATASYIVGFWYQNSDFNASVQDPDIITFLEGGSTAVLRIGLVNASSTVMRVQDVSSTFTFDHDMSVDTWHLIEVFWQHNNSGNLTIHIDGAEKFNGTKNTGTGTFDTYRLMADDSVGAGDNLFDSFYCMSGATSVSDFLGDVEVFVYQHDGTDYTENDFAISPDDSPSFSNSNDIPFTAGTETVISDDGAAGGNPHTDATDGSRDGPSGGTPDVSGTIVGGKWLHRMKRGSGKGNTHAQKYGYSATISTKDVTLSTSYQNFIIVSEETFEVPSSSQFFGLGAGHNAAGAQDTYVQDMCAFLLHVPSGVVVDTGWLSSPITVPLPQGVVASGPGAGAGI